MAQADGAGDDASNRLAAVDESDDDLGGVDVPFSIIDYGSSDDDNLKQTQDSGNHIDHTKEIINENAIIDCFNFSVNAHIKGKFEPPPAPEANEKKEMCNDAKEEAATEKNSTQNSKPVGWIPASLPLPAWAASD